jgi:hypothetical protein
VCILGPNNPECSYDCEREFGEFRSVCGGDVALRCVDAATLDGDVVPNSIEDIYILYCIYCVIIIIIIIIINIILTEKLLIVL